MKEENLLDDLLSFASSIKAQGKQWLLKAAWKLIFADTDKLVGARPAPSARPRVGLLAPSALPRDQLGLRELPVD